MSGDLETQLQKLLMRYRLTLHATTGCAPSDIMLKWRLRSKLDQIWPDINRKVCHKQSQMKESHSSKERSLEVNDPVLVKNFGPGPTHLYGSIRHQISPTIFEVILEDGRAVRWHLDHLCKCWARRTHQGSANSDTTDRPVNLEGLIPQLEPKTPGTLVARPDPKPEKATLNHSQTTRWAPAIIYCTPGLAGYPFDPTQLWHG